MIEKKKPGLTITEEPGGYLRKILTNYGDAASFDKIVLPHNDLISFMDGSFQDYYALLTKLEEHPLFEESLDVSEADFRDFMEQSYAATETLAHSFPEAYFFTVSMLDDVATFNDDGSASFLLHAGMFALSAVKTPYLTRVRMRNMMEVCFGTTEGMSQSERYERLLSVYPILRDHEFAVHWKLGTDGQWVREYRIHSLLELYFFELLSALRSEKRIARCQHCWHYFVPKTKKKTDYCDRVWVDGKTCKNLGPNLKRKDGPAEDRYLLAFKQLRARFYERDYREYADEHRFHAAHYECYEDWMEDASAAREEYLLGKITGEEFLHRINPEGEEVASVPTKETPAEQILYQDWDKLVTGDMSFDPLKHFSDTMFLDLSQPNLSWKTVSSSELIRRSKQGNLSLREKYKKEE